MTAYTAVKRSELVFESGRLQRVATFSTFLKFFQFCDFRRSGEVQSFLCYVRFSIKDHTCTTPKTPKFSLSLDLGRVITSYR